MGDILNWIKRLIARAHQHDWVVADVRLEADGKEHEIDLACACGAECEVFGSASQWRNAQSGFTVGPAMALRFNDVIALARRKQRIALREATPQGGGHG